LVTGTGAAVAMIVKPVAGALSDRTTSRFGRRRWWTTGGALAGAAARLPQTVAAVLAVVLVTRVVTGNAG
jgi:MFS family permease